MGIIYRYAGIIREIDQSRHAAAVGSPRNNGSRAIQIILVSFCCWIQEALNHVTQSMGHDCHCCVNILKHIQWKLPVCSTNDKKLVWYDKRLSWLIDIIKRNITTCTVLLHCQTGMSAKAWLWHFNGLAHHQNKARTCQGHHCAKKTL